MHVSAWNVALQAVNFVVLAWLLQRFLFKPVRAVFRKRQDEVLSSLRDAATKKLEADRVVEEYRGKSAALATEAERAREQALGVAEVEARRLRQDAEHQIAAGLESAKAELAQERARILRSLEVQASSLATSIAERLLRDALPDCDAPFLWRATAIVDALDPARRAALGKQMASGNVEAISSRPLDVATRKRFDQWLTDLAGEPVAATYRVDPTLIAGVELRLPAGVWRSHWRASLERIRAELEAHVAAA
jgi:F-type H+-transporting ATPase subunit b